MTEQTLYSGRISDASGERDAIGLRTARYKFVCMWSGEDAPTMDRGVGAIHPFMLFLNAQVLFVEVFATTSSYACARAKANIFVTPLKIHKSCMFGGICAFFLCLLCKQTSMKTTLFT